MTKIKLINILCSIAVVNAVLWAFIAVYHFTAMDRLETLSDSWSNHSQNIIKCMIGVLCSNIPLIVAGFINSSRQTH